VLAGWPRPCYAKLPGGVRVSVLVKRGAPVPVNRMVAIEAAGATPGAQPEYPGEVFYDWLDAWFDGS
jgi:hypothetical protein